MEIDPTQPPRSKVSGGQRPGRRGNGATRWRKNASARQAPDYRTQRRQRARATETLRSPEPVAEFVEWSRTLFTNETFRENIVNMIQTTPPEDLPFPFLKMLFEQAYGRPRGFAVPQSQRVAPVQFTLRIGSGQDVPGIIPLKDGRTARLMSGTARRIDDSEPEAVSPIDGGAPALLPPVLSPRHQPQPEETNGTDPEDMPPDI